MEEVKKTNRLKKYLILISLGILLVLAGWLYYSYWFVYSEGTRVGILYKFSKKGTIFKTYEGEMLLPGIGNKTSAAGTMITNNFLFSVDDQKLANKLMTLQGMELELHYENYNRALPWRGDNYNKEDGQYVVDKMVKIKNKEPRGYGL
jgi:hypothetical protein